MSDTYFSVISSAGRSAWNWATTTVDELGDDVSDAASSVAESVIENAGERLAARVYVHFPIIGLIGIEGCRCESGEDSLAAQERQRAEMIQQNITNLRSENCEVREAAIETLRSDPDLTAEQEDNLILSLLDNLETNRCGNRRELALLLGGRIASSYEGWGSWLRSCPTYCERLVTCFISLVREDDEEVKQSAARALLILSSLHMDPNLKLMMVEPFIELLHTGYADAVEGLCYIILCSIPVETPGVPPRCDSAVSAELRGRMLLELVYALQSESGEVRTAASRRLRDLRGIVNLRGLAPLHLSVRERDVSLFIRGLSDDSCEVQTVSARTLAILASFDIPHGRREIMINPLLVTFRAAGEKCWSVGETADLRGAAGAALSVILESNISDDLKASIVYRLFNMRDTEQIYIRYYVIDCLSNVIRYHLSPRLARIMMNVLAQFTRDRDEEVRGDAMQLLSEIADSEYVTNTMRERLFDIFAIGSRDQCPGVRRC